MKKTQRNLASQTSQVPFNACTNLKGKKPFQCQAT